MTDRRPLGTGTDRATTSRTQNTDPVPAPRAQLPNASRPSRPPSRSRVRQLGAASWASAPARLSNHPRHNWAWAALKAH